MKNLENTILNEVEELERRIKEGEDLNINEIKEIETKLESLDKIDTNLEYLLKHKLLKLRRKSLKNTNKATKWDLFCEDMDEIEGIEPIIQLIDFINERKDNAISKEELAELEAMYTNILPLIHEKLSAYDRDRAIKEFNKKIKLFNNRLSRVIEDDFGSWIKQLRLAKGYSLKDLENASGVTASYIHRIESGSRKTPSVPVAEKLAIGLGVSPDEFLRKLNLVSSDTVDRKIALTELIAKSTFTINEEQVTIEQKNTLLNVINSILNADWTADSKFNEGMNIVNEIDKFKATLNK